MEHLGWFVFLLAFFGLSFLAHRWLYRWLSRSYPIIVAKFRSPLLVILAVLFVLPLLRIFAWQLPWIVPLVGIGMCWHFVVMATALPMWGLRGGLKLVEKAEPAETEAQEEILPELQVERVNAGVPLASDLPKSPERRALIETLAGTALLSATGSAMGWGMVRGRFDWQIEEVPIRMPKLPRALDGFTIVQISDIHVGTFVDEDILRRGLSRIAEAKPDLVAITGDIIDIDPRWAKMGGALLGAVKARHGVVCVPGNHDHYTGIEEVTLAMQRGGIDVLTNRGKVIESAGSGGLAILGVDDLWAKKIPGHGPDLARARSMVPKDMATVLLAHQPPFVKETAGHDIDLQLSGHTHGGQLNPGFTPAHLVMRYVAGVYEHEGTTLYVNRGFGTAGPPSRVGAPPEITKLVLVAG